MTSKNQGWLNSPAGKAHLKRIASKGGLKSAQRGEFTFNDPDKARAAGKLGGRPKKLTNNHNRDKVKITKEGNSNEV